MILSSGALPANCYWAQPHSLLAGEYPADRNPKRIPPKLAQYLDCGITAFLDLTEAHEDLRPYDGVLQPLAAARGVDCAYRRMPIVDVSTPHSPSLMRDILAQLDSWMGEDRRVYVHCWGGVGRTGTAIGCWLVERGMTGAQALQHLQQLWVTNMSAEKLAKSPQSPETHAQRNYVADWPEVSAIQRT